MVVTRANFGANFSSSFFCLPGSSGVANQWKFRMVEMKNG
jgi:hypothetical protein